MAKNKHDSERDLARMSISIRATTRDALAIKAFHARVSASAIIEAALLDLFERSTDAEIKSLLVRHNLAHKRRK